MNAKHTNTSQLIADLWSQSKLNVKLDLNLPVAGRTVGDGVGMLINGRMHMEDILSNIVHEGRHTLDIANGLIPKSGAKGEKLLFAEGRAHFDAAEFAKLNDFRNSQSYGHSQVPLIFVLDAIVDGPAYKAIGPVTEPQRWRILEEILSK